MSVTRPRRTSVVLAFVVLAGCADSTVADPIAPEATESLLTIVGHRAVVAGEKLPSVRVMSSGGNVIVAVSRPSLCGTHVSAQGARGGGALVVIARPGSSPLGDCAPNIPVTWVVDYLVTIPRVDEGTWDVRVFEVMGTGSPVFIGQQQVRVL